MADISTAKVRDGPANPSHVLNQDQGNTNFEGQTRQVNRNEMFYSPASCKILLVGGKSEFFGRCEDNSVENIYFFKCFRRCRTSRN